MFEEGKYLQEGAPRISAEDRATSAFVGTPLYLAPEMISHNASTAGLDIWAIGCTIYQMLVGQTPFFSPGATEIAVMDRIENG